MPLVFNTKTYTGDKYGVDVVGYIGAAKTLTVADDLLMSRVAAKPTATFSGVARFQAKLTRTHTLTGSLTPTGSGLYIISGSVPVGAAGADIDAAINDMAALFALADFKTFVKTQKISY